MSVNSISVHKFGGTSVGSLGNIRNIQSIILEEKKNNKQVLIVVSAIGLVTDYLQDIWDFCLENDWASAEKQWEKLEMESWNLANQVLHEDKKKLEKLSGFWKNHSFSFQKLKELNSFTNKIYSLFLSQGEYFSSLLLSIKLEAEFFDATNVIRTDSNYLKANPITKEIKKLALKVLKPLLEVHPIIITQGFIGEDEIGHRTLLGRGGSDTSAALFAQALECSHVYIWTDVDGVYTADPRLVKNARPIPTLTYEQAAELAQYGGKVIAPGALIPISQNNIIMYVRSTQNPLSLGTTIKNEDENYQIQEMRKVCAIVTKEDQLLVSVKKIKMPNSYGHLFQIFKILADFNISIEMITTSQQSTSFTLEYPQLWNDQVKQRIENECMLEVLVEKNLGMISFIGGSLAPWKNGPFDFLHPAQVKGVFLGPLKQNLSILLDSSTKVTELLQVFHQKYIEEL